MNECNAHHNNILALLSFFAKADAKVLLFFDIKKSLFFRFFLQICNYRDINLLHIAI